MVSSLSLTNADAHFEGRPNAVILTAQGFQDHDNIYCAYRLRGARMNVRFATADGQPVIGKYGTRVPLDNRAEPCLTFDDLDVAKFDVVIATGGHEAPDRVRQDARATGFVAGMDTAGKLVAGLCHGPWVQVSAGILRGRHVAAYPGLRDDVKHAGAIVVDGVDVVVDGNLVTGSYYGEAGLFMETLVELIERRHAGREVAA